MKYFVACILLLMHFFSFGQSIPVPDHIVIVLEENRNYSEIVGNHLAPYINSLLADTSTAVFSNSYALTSGSQPNYLMLFSGSTQGVVGSTITSTQYTDCNLGASLLSNSKTFLGYSEDLPSVGFLGITSGNYARKHNPWSDWQGTGTDELPPTVNLPLTSLPTNFDSLPTVAFIVPNLMDDMHTPSDSTAIAPGDSWLNTHLNSYIQWAKLHNSLFILDYDESSTDTTEHILTFFMGQYVQGGTYPEYINDYHILRTIEQLYTLPYCANSDTVTAITSFWKLAAPSSTKQVGATAASITAWPVPSAGNITLSIDQPVAGDVQIAVCDAVGKILKSNRTNLQGGHSEWPLDLRDLSNGIYFVKCTGEQGNCYSKIVIER